MYLIVAKNGVQTRHVIAILFCIYMQNERPKKMAPSFVRLNFTKY